MWGVLQMTTSPEVLSQASRCPYIQKVVAETGDPQTVRTSCALPPATCGALSVYSLLAGGYLSLNPCMQP